MTEGPETAHCAICNMLALTSTAFVIIGVKVARLSSSARDDDRTARISARTSD